MKYIEIPVNCPICNSILVREKKNRSEILKCVNPLCENKLEGRILHFIGPSGLDIESMSKKTVTKLISLCWIHKLSDIFNLKSHKDEWITLDGFGENSVDKILEAIPKSLELWKVIASAGIPNIEKKTSTLLADHFLTYTAFREAVDNKYDFTQIAGIGEITSAAITNFDYSEIDDVMNYLIIKDTVVGGKLENKSFCITGKLSMKRDDLVKIIEANGGKIASVNKNLTYLICNDKTSTSGKSKKAMDLGIPVISEDEFMELIR